MTLPKRTRIPLAVLKGLIALAAVGVLAAPLPSSDIGSCTVTELEPADPITFCEDLRVVQDRLSRRCDLPVLSEEERDCENFHFGVGCNTSQRSADHCLDVLYALDEDECGRADDVRDIDVPECGSCPGGS